jgi:hypothetical protein
MLKGRTRRIVTGQGRPSKIDFAIRDRFSRAVESDLDTILVLVETGLGSVGNALTLQPVFGPVIRSFGWQAAPQRRRRQKRTTQTTG